jgi:hypothetical protein
MATSLMGQVFNFLVQNSDKAFTSREISKFLEENNPLENKPWKKFTSHSLISLANRNKVLRKRYFYNWYYGMKNDVIENRIKKEMKKNEY